MARFSSKTDSPAAADAVPAAPEASSGALAVPGDASPAPMSASVIARVREAVSAIPGDDGSGAERIVTQLLDATTIDDLNAPWAGTSGRNLAGRQLVIRGVTQRPSTFEDGAGIFLVADALDRKTGEPCVFTTSAVSVVIQLAKVHQLGMWPVIADVVVAERPTERGFYPYHLRIVAAGNTAQTDAR